MKISKYLAPLFIISNFIFAQSSLAQNNSQNSKQKLALSVKPAVVRIWNPCFGIYEKGNIEQEFDLSFLGTGFFINPRGYIVTSASVMDKNTCLERLANNIEKAILNNYGNEIYAKEIRKFLIEKNNYLFDNKVYLPNSNIDPFPIKVRSDIRDNNKNLVEIGDIEIGDDVAILKIPVNHAPSIELGDSSKVTVQDEVITVGYPTNIKIDLIEGKFTNKSLYEASVQEGSIASTAKRLQDGYSVLQVDIQAKRGNGGSPIINQQGQVVGMLVSRQYGTFKDDIPLAITTDTIQDFMDVANTNNDFKGATNLMYQKGLDLFFKKKYKEAEKLFKDVNNSYKIDGISAHSEIQKLLDKIDRTEADWWEKPLTNPTNFLILALLFAGGIIGTVAYFLLRQRPQFIGAVAGSQERSSNADSQDRSNNADSTHNTSYKRNGKGKKCYMEMEYKGQIKRFQLGRDEHRLGRDPVWSDLDVFATWEVISRRHAILKQEGDDYRIFDGDRTNPSRNGLWVTNDFRVDTQKGHLLNNGDRLKIGQDANDQVLLTYYNPRGRNQGGGSNPRTTMAN